MGCTIVGSYVELAVWNGAEHAASNVCFFLQWKGAGVGWGTRYVSQIKIMQVCEELDCDWMN